MRSCTTALHAGALLTSLARMQAPTDMRSSSPLHAGSQRPMQVGACGGGQAEPPCTPGMGPGQPCTPGIGLGPPCIPGIGFGPPCAPGTGLPTKVRMVCFRGSGRPHLPLRSSRGREPAAHALTALSEQPTVERRARCGARRMHAPHAHGRQARERRRAGRAAAPEDADGHPQAPRQALGAPERQHLADARMVHRHQVCAHAPAYQPRVHHMHRTIRTAERIPHGVQAGVTTFDRAHQLPPGWPCARSPCAWSGRCSPCWGRQSGRCLPPGLARETGRCMRTRPHSAHHTRAYMLPAIRPRPASIVNSHARTPAHTASMPTSGRIPGRWRRAAAGAHQQCPRA
jgi:hypothetical protein